jgi:hypothetical protein
VLFCQTETLPSPRGFSRYHKYTLGAALREGARRVLKLIVRANALCRLAEYPQASRE